MGSSSKAPLDLLHKWPEYLSGLAVVLCFILAIISQSAGLTYFLAIVLGFFSARIYFTRIHEEPIGPFILIIMAAFIGFLIGSVFANRILIIIIYLGSYYLSFLAHKNKIIKTFKSKAFLK